MTETIWAVKGVFDPLLTRGPGRRLRGMERMQAAVTKGWEWEYDRHSEGYEPHGHPLTPVGAWALELEDAS